MSSIPTSSSSSFSSSSGPAPSHDEQMQAIAAALSESIRSDRRISHVSSVPLPDRAAVEAIVQRLVHLMYPGFFCSDACDVWLPDQIDSIVAQQVEGLCGDLSAQIARALVYEAAAGTPDRTIAPSDEVIDRARLLATMYLRTLPDIRRMLSLDVHAAYEGDPAAEHTDEIIFCYPGLMALTMHRLAHELYLLNVPLIPRIINEIAHTATGIDIHPGARIGRGFFIDHGTGVVIGETTFIGDHCKIYQGVTLGAVSDPRDEHGNLRRDVKRHPTLEDRVTVYAGATILGGDTIIGRGAVVDGGVFLTHSVPAGHVVRAAETELVVINSQ